MVNLEVDAEILANPYLCHIRAQRLLAEDMKALRDSGEGLARMNISAGRDPNSLKSSVVEHVVVVAVDSNAKFFVLGIFFCPLYLMRRRTAHSYHFGMRNSVQERVNMSLAL